MALGCVDSLPDENKRQLDSMISFVPSKMAAMKIFYKCFDSKWYELVKKSKCRPYVV